MNNHAQMTPAQKRPDLRKVVMQVGAGLAIAGFLFATRPLGAQEAKATAAASAGKQAGKTGSAKKKSTPKLSPAIKRAMRAQTPAFSEGNFLLVDLSADANDNFANPIGKAPLLVGPVPFRLPQGDKDHLNLRQARWNGWEQDLPWSHESPQPTKLHDPTMPILRVPVADYLAAHVLAIADDNPDLAPAFTLRVGKVPTTGNQQCVQFDFAAQAPRRSQVTGANAATLVKTAGQDLCYVRVPTIFAFAQDIDTSTPLEIEITKEVRLARRSPDPARYRYRPLGLPSGVRIAAITLEKSPLQMRVTSAESGHAFVEPQVPTFKVSLVNITPASQTFTLVLQAVHLDGTKADGRRSGRVEPGHSVDISVPLAVGKRGYYDLSVTLQDGDQQTLLCRQTSFGLLPPDIRKHRDESPFGTYDFGGAHYTCGDYDKTGPLYVKLGMRYGMFGNRALEARRKYGLVKGNEPRITDKNAQKGYDSVLAANPDLPPRALIFHETSISKKHVTRVPDLFTDRPVYTLDADEEAKFKAMWNLAVSAAQAMRRNHAEVKLALGNGALPTKEDFLRRKFPAELFDSAGNECAAYGHPPEAQPPNWLANNASLWMDRQMLDAYGYRDKPVAQCYEVCYPSTNPGNLDFKTQADYFVRHAMHSLAWGVPAFRPGIITDVGGNYRWSHWGSAGFCHMFPELNVKPAFVAFATMTLVLDGATFVRETPLGSPSLYGVEFIRPDGSQVFVLWTLHGRRPVTLSLDSSGPWKLLDDQANETVPDVAKGKLQVTLTSSPVYLIGKGRLTGVFAGPPIYDDKPDGKTSTLSSLDGLKDWVVETGRSPELEFYNFMTPRRKGEFTFQSVPTFEGRSGSLCVAPQPITRGKDTMPMYAVLAHKTGIPVPGIPTEIGLWINGNSGWGRVIFELTDASRQRWISIGAQSKIDPGTILPKDVLARFRSPGVSDWNTEDAWASSRINFDGWRYVAFPLPGNYPGEHYGWPANSQWRWDKDGVVHYPFTLRRLVVELNEKVLHLRTFAPVPRPEIYLKDLIATQGDTVRVKQTVGD